MNGSLKLTLAVALALSSTNALALGLGMIQVKSGLNEPLVAEIPVTGGPDETASVSVALAAASDFERVGLSRSRILVPLEFAVATGAKGNAVIKVTTKEPVRDPFLDFLIEVNWAKGKLLREYTVLLDPPTMAPAIKGSRASTAPVRDGATPAASTQLPSAKPSKPSGRPARTTDTAAAPAPAAPSVPAAPRSAASGEYGPVAQGETLWEVAAATRPDESVSLNQVMVALLRNNPNAFYRDNINSLKRGAILRVPSADEIRAAGSAAAAAAEVRSQNDAARGGAAAPTLVADTGATPSRPSGSASTASTAKPGDRLELVPPKSGKDASASAERPGAGGTGDSTVRAELARTKEALASSNQEASELKSRVRELEELKTKNDKLLTLKDSELAALQQKLKELQDKASKPAAPATAATPPPASTTAPAATTTPPASTTTTVTAPKPGDKGGALTKEEIWGTASSTPPAGTSTPSTTPSATSTPPAATPGSTTTPPVATTAPSSTATPPVSTPSATPGTTTPAATPSTTPGITPDPSATATTTPPGATATTPPAATTAPPATTTPAKPATSTTAPAKPSTPAKVQPLPAAKPWYMEPMTWVYGLGGLAVLGALGFLGSRLLGGKKSTAAAAGAGAYAETTSPLQDEEDALLDRLAQYPDDTSAHLELTSLYYSQGDADKFEAAAQAMYAHIYDTNMPEWQQVQAMGRELVPSNPLFAEPVASSAPAFGSYQHASPEPMRFDGFDDGFGAPPAAPAASKADDDAFDFDLADRSAAPPAPAARDDFSFDLTPPPAAATPPPPSNYQTQVQPLPPIPDLAPLPSRVDDDLLASDDAIGTKLDLAKAYLDMGDPDGARSMLEEVLIEGSDSQKGEARKLLAEIR
ncbi:MAG TPA: FimV/HubP family polar landmark protein [Tahibacter sp.]|uniref:FimV/HubP family polar landmark protein n=1 Tax=Tahibacter sp. TaxID=2056211 RepID=UPI002BC89502|nr:FimV/HubP family polar landmark protein [Tahibacter sp.]HSX62988.1 FimV/HubP family polar landmark protein [Tahibacter sp.]